MTVISPPLFQTVDSVYTGASLGVPYRDIMSEGVVGVNDMKVAQRGAGANLSVDVAAGVAWIKGDDNANTQPLYRAYNDGTVNLSIAAADGANPRIDRVIAEVRDSSFSGVSQDWRLRVITGTPAGSPSAPALPNNAISLATVSVPALDTTISDAQITDTRPSAVLGFGQARMPSANAFRSGTQLINNATWTPIQWNAESWDTHGMHDNSTNPSRFTAQKAGLYLVTCNYTMNASSGGEARLVGLSKNGAIEHVAYRRSNTVAFLAVCQITAQIFLSRGDYVQGHAYQDSGGGLNIITSAVENPSYMVVTMIAGDPTI